MEPGAAVYTNQTINIENVNSENSVYASAASSTNPIYTIATPGNQVDPMSTVGVSDTATVAYEAKIEDTENNANEGYSVKIVDEEPLNVEAEQTTHIQGENP